MRHKTNESRLSVLYEDNHIIAVNKSASDLVQGDKTGDETLADKVKSYIKKKYNKPGDVYLGVVHRLDRPVSGVVIYARTSKAASRLSKLFKDKEIKKTYWAIVKDKPNNEEGHLEHFLLKHDGKNKSYASEKQKLGSKKAILNYKLIAGLNHYYLLEVDLETGRHHQIRCQLSKIGSPIKGDLKYGFSRSNEDGGISLHARKIEFIHPIKKENLSIIAPPPKDVLWNEFLNTLK